MEPLSSIKIEQYFQERNQGQLDLIPHVELLEEIDSTNLEWKRRIQSLGFGEDIFSHIPEASVLLSDYQTAGKGRMGRSFLSPKGTGLYFSILTKPKGENKNPLVLTCHAAVAVKRAVKELFQIELSVKWVNDLFYRGKKVAGILAEGQLRSGERNGNLSIDSMQTGKDSASLVYCIMGIGINLFQPEGGFPEELSGIAGSLFAETKEVKADLDRNRLLATILYHYFSLLDQEEVEEEYRKENMLLSKEIRFTENGLELFGTVESILENGALSVLSGDGKRRIVSSGEVKEKFCTAFTS